MRIRKTTRSQLDNRGLSIVELIVAVSIGAIVAASVSALIGYSIRAYHNESVNTEMQYELQTNVNQIMDTIMASSGAVIVQASGRTDYAGFGKFDETRNSDGVVTSVKFSGVVLKSYDSDGDGKYEIYMSRVPDSGAISKTTALLAVGEAVKTINDATDKTPYLLGNNVKKFYISIDTDTSTSSCIVSDTEYINPLLVNVELEFEKEGSGRTFTKTVNDNAIMRNKVTSDIWINGSQYVLKK